MNERIRRLLTHRWKSYGIGVAACIPKDTALVCTTSDGLIADHIMNIHNNSLDMGNEPEEDIVLTKAEESRLEKILNSKSKHPDILFLSSLVMRVYSVASVDIQREIDQAELLGGDDADPDQGTK
jgi:hypothetical protein